MRESWMSNADLGWPAEATRQTLDDIGRVLKRNLDTRVRRGDIRAAILRLLVESPMHGYQIIHEVETRSGGVWKPSPGSVYPTLQLLADEGLVESQEANGRRTYSLTAAGREAADAESQAPAPWLEGSRRAAGPGGSLAAAGLQIAKAAAEVARRGSAAQVEQASKILDEATEALKRVLSPQQ